MWEIWEVLRRIHRGEGQRAVQRGGATFFL
jgi:hypothetical protein